MYIGFYIGAIIISKRFYVKFFLRRRAQDEPGKGVTFGFSRAHFAYHGTRVLGIVPVFWNDEEATGQAANRRSFAKMRRNERARVTMLGFTKATQHCKARGAQPCNETS